MGRSGDDTAGHYHIGDLIMAIFIASFSILGITIFIRFLNKAPLFKVCPLCAGVSATWFWIAAGMTAGWLAVEDWQLIAAMLMGGTVVGVAYQGERRYPQLAKNIFYFKVPVILAGFLFVWWAINTIGWLSLGVELLILAAVMYAYFISPVIRLKRETDPVKVAELEKKLEECCD